jgi:hypothetical protein
MSASLLYNAVSQLSSEKLDDIRYFVPDSPWRIWHKASILGLAKLGKRFECLDPMALALL